MIELTPEQKLVRARTLLLLDQPFFGTLALRLSLVRDTKVSTAAVNGVRIRYNPKWIERQDLSAIKTVLAHEVMHVANGHCWRRDDRDKWMWNKACDYAINDLLRQSGFVMPDDAYVDTHVGSAEQIYSDLQQKEDERNEGDKGSRTQAPSQNPNTGPTGAGEVGQNEEDAQQDEQDEELEADAEESESCSGEEGAAVNQDYEVTPDPGQMGAVEDAPDDTADSMPTEWAVAVSQAYQVAKTAGPLPADLVRLIGEIVSPKVPWSIVLRDFVERAARNDYDWRVPNRRHLQRGFILPSLISEEIPNIVIVIDTSASIRKEELDQFASEVSAVLSAYATTIHVLYCDTEVRRVDELARADLPLHLEPVGGGGTRFKPAFDKVDELGLEPACLIYLTDLRLYGAWPDEPDYPTLWVTTEPNREAPFGLTIELN